MVTVTTSSEITIDAQGFYFVLKEVIVTVTETRRKNCMKKPAIGFIGLGVMGMPMARHLAEAGYHMAVYDIIIAKADQLSREFAKVQTAESPEQVAEFSDIVVTMLPTGKHVQEVIQGKDGLIQGYRPGSLHLDTSSAEPWLIVESAGILGEMNVAMVDSPVSGA